MADRPELVAGSFSELGCLRELIKLTHSQSHSECFQVAVIDSAPARTHFRPRAGQAWLTEGAFELVKNSSRGTE